MIGYLDGNPVCNTIMYLEPAMEHVSTVKKLLTKQAPEKVGKESKITVRYPQSLNL